MIRLKTHELLLIECIFFALIWIADEYTAFLLSILITVILFCILIISLISEMIERSKVPRSFFIRLLLSLIPPIVLLVMYYSASDGFFDWLEM